MLSFILKISMHIATLPTAIKGYNEFPLTTVKPSQFRINNSIALIHSVIHTYYPEMIEPINVHYQDQK